MKISTIPNDNALYIKENSICGMCYHCLSKNVTKNECLDCHNDGRTLYYLERTINIKKHTLKMMFKLSIEQERLSKIFLEHFLHHKNAFLYAVCGSGKTEIMYESILCCLNRGLKPLIAIPRKEIVRELYERLIKVFPDTNISFLDGSHHSDEGELVISTVNQLINYEDEFDLVILDEMDAYPFFGSEYLHRLLMKSLKKDGVLFLMSATIKEKVHCDIYTLKRRYHGHELSMPKFIKIEKEESARLGAIHNIIKGSNRKFVIYVSSINKAKKLARELGVQMISSTSLDPSRIIGHFKINDEEILVSTTILERGITIPNLDVIVLDADSPIFTYQTLIQISGRVGRSYADPDGNIYILYERNQLKFILVKNYIRRMNKCDVPFVESPSK